MQKVFQLILLLLVSTLSNAQIHLPAPAKQDSSLIIMPIDQWALAYLEGGGIGMMNTKGNRLTPATYFSFIPVGEKYYAAQQKENGKFALINAEGRLLTPFEFSEIQNMQNGRARVKRNLNDQSKFAVLSNDGLILSDWYDSLSSHSGDHTYLIFHQNKLGIWHSDSLHFFEKDFEDLGLFNSGLAPAAINNLYGYIQTDGTWKINPEFKKTLSFQGKYAPVQLQNGKWQIINRDGKLLLPHPCDSVQIFQDGAYSIVRRNNHHYYLDYALNYLNSRGFIKAEPFGNEGIAKAKEDSKEVYLHSTGEIFFEADSLLFFQFGAGAFLLNGKWGWINESGEIIQSPKYDKIADLNSKQLLVTQKGKQLLVNHAGQIIREISSDTSARTFLTDKALFYELKPTYYLIDLLQSNYKELPYDEAGDITDGLIAVKKDGKYGYTDLNGKEIVPPENYSVSLPSDNLIFIQKNPEEPFIAFDKNLRQQFQLDYGIRFLGLWKSGRAKVINSKGLMGFIDQTGKLTVPCKYPLLGDYEHGKALFMNNRELFGYLDANGEEAIPPIYKFASEFDAYGYAVAVKDQLFGFIRQDGKVVIPFQYEQALSLKNGIASVSKNGKVGYINMQNKTQIPFTFDEGYQLNEDLALVRMGQYWGYINGRGKVKIPWQYAEAQPFSEGRAWARLSDKFGMIDSRGTFMTPFIYEKAMPFKNGFAAVRENGKWGMVNIHGAKVISPVCDIIGTVEQYKVVAATTSGGFGILPLE